MFHMGLWKKIVQSNKKYAKGTKNMQGNDIGLVIPWTALYAYVAFYDLYGLMFEMHLN